MKVSDLLAISPYVRWVRTECLTYPLDNFNDYDYVFLYVPDGTLNYSTNGRKYVLSAGCGILTPPFFAHFTFSAENTTLFVVHFDFYTRPERVALQSIGASVYAGEIPDEVLHPKEENVQAEPVFYSFFGHDRVNVKNIMENLLSFYREGGKELRLKSEMIKLLDLLASVESSAAMQEHRDIRAWPLVIRAAEYIEKNYADTSISNEAIYKETGFSRSYLANIFADATGLTLHQYLSNVRISHAIELMVTKEYSPGNVYRKVGFVSQHSFIRQFKVVTGMTPSQYMFELR